jgi:hypothetical protein
MFPLLLIIFEFLFDGNETKPAVFSRRSVGKAEFAQANQADLLFFPSNEFLFDASTGIIIHAFAFLSI